MCVQLIGSISHLFWCYLYILVFKMGLIGCGLAQASTNVIILIGNLYMKQMQEDLKEARKISILDCRIYKNWLEYLQIGFPSASICFLDWVAFEILALFAGTLGVEQQAA